jgi:hypothetical protein
MVMKQTSEKQKGLHSHEDPLLPQRKYLKLSSRTSS